MIRVNVEFVTSKLNGQTIVAATKYASVDKMKELYACGITNFGENRVDSFFEKQEAFFGYDITWHFIGHLQRNKCKQIISKIDCLHSLDSLRPCKNDSKQSRKDT